MTLFLKNTSKDNSLSLRYGDGLRNLIQLAPGAIEVLPRAFTTKLLKNYLATFKDLKVVEEKSVEIKDESTTNNDAKPDGEQNDDSNPDESGEGQEGQEGSDHSREDDESGTPEGQEGSEGDNESQEGSENPDESGKEPATNNDAKPVEKSENEIKKMNAEELKAYAKEIGLDFEEDITKKALLAVILSKQVEE